MNQNSWKCYEWYTSLLVLNIVSSSTNLQFQRRPAFVLKLPLNIRADITSLDLFFFKLFIIIESHRNMIKNTSRIFALELLKVQVCVRITSFFIGFLCNIGEFNASWIHFRIIGSWRWQCIWIIKLLHIEQYFQNTCVLPLLVLLYRWQIVYLMY